MFNAKRFNTDAFTDGVWVNILGGDFKIARAGNPEYEQALESSGYRKMDDPAEKQRALYRAIAKGVLKDWSGVVDEHDQPIPFNVGNAVEVLIENPDLVSRLLSESNDLSNYKRESIEADKERAVGFSDGAKSGSGQGKATKKPASTTVE